MSRAAPELLYVASRILADEGGIRLEKVELADTAEKAFMKLGQFLAQLIGSYATHLLINRAIDETAAEFAFLKGVEIDSDTRLMGLRENVARQDPDEVHAGLAMMLANSIALLSDMIGEDMALYLLNIAWPGLMSGEQGSRQEGEIR